MVNSNQIPGSSSPFYLHPNEILKHHWFLLDVVMDRKEIIKLKGNKAKVILQGRQLVKKIDNSFHVVNYLIVYKVSYERYRRRLPTNWLHV